jgi:hypothetical protein
VVCPLDDYFCCGVTMNGIVNLILNGSEEAFGGGGGWVII